MKQQNRDYSAASLQCKIWIHSPNVNQRGKKRDSWRSSFRLRGLTNHSSAVSSGWWLVLPAALYICCWFQLKTVVIICISQVEWIQGCPSYLNVHECAHRYALAHTVHSFTLWWSMLPVSANTAEKLVVMNHYCIYLYVCLPHFFELYLSKFFHCAHAHCLISFVPVVTFDVHLRTAKSQIPLKEDCTHTVLCPHTSPLLSPPSSAP